MGRSTGTAGGSLRKTGSFSSSEEARWAGARGEQATADIFARANTPATMLHDIDLTKSNIDHVHISGRKITPIDSKAWRGGVYWTPGAVVPPVVIVAGVVATPLALDYGLAIVALGVALWRLLPRGKSFRGFFHPVYDHLPAMRIGVRFLRSKGLRVCRPIIVVHSSGQARLGLYRPQGVRAMTAEQFTAWVQRRSKRADPDVATLLRRYLSEPAESSMGRSDLFRDFA